MAEVPPFAKQLVGQISPLLLAGLLYAGSGMGLILTRLIKDCGWHHSGLVKNDWIWLIGAIGFGGVLGPILLMYGLQQTSAATTSLLLNFEAVLTALLAWIIFKENTAHRIVLGMFLIIAGGVLLSWPHGEANNQNALGSVAIIGACLCWAIDNNLTRKVSAGDPFFIAGSKGFVSGIVFLFYQAYVARTAILLSNSFTITEKHRMKKNNSSMHSPRALLASPQSILGSERWC